MKDWIYFKLIVAYCAVAAFVLFGLPAAAQMEAGVTFDGTAPTVPPWAPAIVPLLVYVIKSLVEYGIPDTLIQRIRDEYLPVVAVLVGTLGTSIATGQVDWTQGPIVGLAGIGLHQLWRQLQKRVGG